MATSKAAVGKGRVGGPSAGARELSHFDAEGQARMVDVSIKPETHRVAVASGQVLMKPSTAKRIAKGEMSKGDVLGIARIAGIQGIKRTAELIPLCHPLRISGVDIEMRVSTRSPAGVKIRVEVQAIDRTGVEMEALMAVNACALTIYDMCKGVDRGMRITDVQLEEKRGGKSGHWRR